MVMLFLGDITQQLSLENKLPLLVLLGSFVGLVIFPAHRFFTLMTGNVTHDMPPSCHIALDWFAGIDVDDFVEKVGLTMLATKVLRIIFWLAEGRGAARV